MQNLLQNVIFAQQLSEITSLVPNTDELQRFNISFKKNKVTAAVRRNGRMFGARGATLELALTELIRQINYYDNVYSKTIN